MQEPELNRGDLDDAAPVRSEAMPTDQHIPFHGVNEDAALRIILEGTATETGERFFQSSGEKSRGGLEYARRMGD
jgi:hypothetical protein